MKDKSSFIPWDLPIGEDNSSDPALPKEEDGHIGDVHDVIREAKFSIAEVSHLLDQMITDIQHLELEIVRARYRLSLYLKPPYDEYLRMDIFSSMGTR